MNTTANRSSYLRRRWRDLLGLVLTVLGVIGLILYFSRVIM